MQYMEGNASRAELDRPGISGREPHPSITLEEPEEGSAVETLDE